jgi:hypothetical protein
MRPGDPGAVAVAQPGTDLLERSVDGRRSSRRSAAGRAGNGGRRRRPEQDGARVRRAPRHEGVRAGSTGTVPGGQPAVERRRRALVLVVDGHGSAGSAGRHQSRDVERAASAMRLRGAPRVQRGDGVGGSHADTVGGWHGRASGPQAYGPPAGATTRRGTLGRGCSRTAVARGLTGERDGARRARPQGSCADRRRRSRGRGACTRPGPAGDGAAHDTGSRSSAPGARGR